MNTKDISFISNGLKLNGRIFLAAGDGPKPGVLFVAGAQPGSFANRGAMTVLRERLATAGINSFVFDHPGFGESEGVRSESSLNSRLEDNRRGLECFLASSNTDSERIGLIGSSMGGHVAARLLEEEEGIKALVLDRAAAYSAEAEDKPFDERFSEAIRKERSWVGSPAFAAIELFWGEIMVSYPELDVVIPKEIQKAFLAEAHDKDKTLILPEAGHFFMRDETAEAESARKLFIEQVAMFFRAHLV